MPADATTADQATKDARVTYTPGAEARIRVTVEDYQAMLKAKAVECCNAERVLDGTPEITAEHVRKAAHIIAGSYGIRAKTNWGIQVAEYAAVGAVSVGASNIKDSWGLVLFFLALAVGAVLLIARIMRERGT